MTNPNIHIHIHDETGEYDREMNDAEFAQFTADQLAEITKQNAQLAAEQADLASRTSGITHALSLGFTQAQAEAMFP